MHFKLLVALVSDEKTDAVIEAAKHAGATGSTIISNARGEGLKETTTFFGLQLETPRDMILFLVEKHLSRDVLEVIEKAAEFDTSSGAGIAFQLDVEDAVGVTKQVEVLSDVIEEKL
jgi:nitrogen regulatory protein PII